MSRMVAGSRVSRCRRNRDSSPSRSPPVLLVGEREYRLASLRSGRRASAGPRFWPRRGCVRGCGRPRGQPRRSVRISGMEAAGATWPLGLSRSPLVAAGGSGDGAAPAGGLTASARIASGRAQRRPSQHRHDGEKVTAHDHASATDWSPTPIRSWQALAARAGCELQARRASLSERRIRWRGAVPAARACNRQMKPGRDDSRRRRLGRARARRLLPCLHQREFTVADAPSKAFGETRARLLPVGRHQLGEGCEQARLGQAIPVDAVDAGLHPGLVQ